MLEKIKSILLSCDKIDGYKIIQNKIESNELFFVKKGLDMNRVKKVEHYRLTVYKDFEEDGTKYRGSSSSKLHPTMTEDEITQTIEDAAFATGFIKNAYYPIAKGTQECNIKIDSKFESTSFSDWMPKLVDCIHNCDTYENGGINSSELFLNKVSTRIVNSEGVDVKFYGYNGELEFITNWKEDSEEIELYKDVKFADYCPDLLTESIKEMLNISKEKAVAKPTPALNKLAVLLTGEPVKEFLSYYIGQSSAQNVYNHTSNVKIGENIQGNDTKGDLITITLDPSMENSTLSSPYDEDGYSLKPVELYRNGVLLRYWGDIRYSYYLNVEPTGVIRNNIVSGGSKSIDDFKKESYLELIAFSDFQMDNLTGDFAGEIRLGWYYDGSTKIPVTGGSISGNIKDVQKEMYLSKELQKLNEFVGPKTVKLNTVSIAGVE